MPVPTHQPPAPGETIVFFGDSVTRRLSNRASSPPLTVRNRMRECKYDTFRHFGAPRSAYESKGRTESRCRVSRSMSNGSFPLRLSQTSALDRSLRGSKRESLRRR